jgi:diguanylate cyclase (GGDEF)-like protein
LWGALAVGALLVAAGVAQYRLAANVAVGGTAAAAPGEHAADAKAIVAAYDENLLDPAPAIGAVLDQIAARPGVAEAALVSGEGVELTGGSATPSARLVAETEPPAALGTAVAATLKSGKPSAAADGVVTQPIDMHGDPHALVVLREPVPAVVPLSDLRWIVPVTLAALAALFAVVLLVRRRSLATRHAGALHRAGVDPLTGLGGHRLFREELARQAGASVRRDRSLTLALFDVDFFATVNAAEGLRHGEAVLAEIGAVLRSGRSDDLPFRVGGDQFAVLFPHTNAAEASVAVERIRAAIAGGLPGMTVSAGVAELDPQIPGADSLLAQAELALHDAKSAGRDRLVVFGDTHARTAR